MEMQGDNMEYEEVALETGVDDAFADMHADEESSDATGKVGPTKALRQALATMGAECTKELASIIKSSVKQKAAAEAATRRGALAGNKGVRKC